MPKRLAGYFVCSVVLASRCVSAAPTTGNELVEFCRESEEFCLGYVSGVMDADASKRISISGVFDPDDAKRISAAQTPLTDEELHRQADLYASCSMSIDLQARLAQKQVKWDELAPYQRKLVVDYWTEERFDSLDSIREYCTPLMYRDPSRYCHPSNVTRRQSVAVVNKYLRDNPAVRHIDAQELVVRALANAFPCK